MPSVSGVLNFSTNYLSTAAGVISDIPVVLQDTSTGVGLVVLSNSSGIF